MADAPSVTSTEAGDHRHGAADGQALGTAVNGEGTLSTGEPHLHTAPHQQTRAVLNRLARTEGHVRAIRRMVEEGRPCTDVLIQLAAVRSAVDKVSRIVLEDHLETCLHQAVATGTTETEWHSLKAALDRFLS